MSKTNIIKAVGTAVGVVLAGIAIKFPQYATICAAVAGAIGGWLHLPQPGQS